MWKTCGKNVDYIVYSQDCFSSKEVVEFKGPLTGWDPLDLSKVLDGLQWNGIKNPLPIQAQALPLVLSGLDVIGIAQTGSWANFQV